MFAIVALAVLLSTAAPTLDAAECSTSASFSEGPGRPYFAPAVGNSTVLMINLGFGTTGTRYLHQESCALGLVSCHWLQCCNAHPNVVKAQTRLIRWYQRLEQCARSPSNNETRCAGDALMKREAREALENVLTSGVEVLGDTPYPHLVLELSQALDDRVVFINTVRDANTWAQRRVQEHGTSLVCKCEPYYAITACTSDDTFGPKMLETEVKAYSTRLLLGNSSSTISPTTTLAAMYIAHQKFLLDVFGTRLIFLSPWWFDVDEGDRDNDLFSETLMHILRGEKNKQTAQPLEKLERHQKT